MQDDLNPEIRLDIPNRLKKRLVDDWEEVTRGKKVRARACVCVCVHVCACVCVCDFGLFIPAHNSPGSHTGSW